MPIIANLITANRNSIWDEITARLSEARLSPLGFASTAAMDFCALLSKCLLNDDRAKGSPALQALGFWLRPASIKAMLQDFAGNRPNTLRAPRGVVFQLPPANIETLFGYNAALSLLCGNVTIVRLPGEPKAEQELLLTLIEECCAKADPVIAGRLLFVRYGHDDQITASLSALCDLRMVWGGDDTVAAIRRIPLPPLAREISFGNRFSAAAIKAAAFIKAGEKERAKAIRAFANDLFLFDQMACASPRLLCWVGSEADREKAAGLLYPALAAMADQLGTRDIGANIAKLNAQFLALHDLPIEKTERFGPALTVLTFSNWAGLSPFKDVDYGHGMMLETRMDSLDALAKQAERKDQTLAIWGFDEDEVMHFTTLCAGRGFDRIARFGEALSFDIVWDGENLFDLLTKFVKVAV